LRDDQLSEREEENDALSKAEPTRGDSVGVWKENEGA
jgi:hypothetical protein